MDSCNVRGFGAVGRTQCTAHPACDWLTMHYIACYMKLCDTDAFFLDDSASTSRRTNCHLLPVLHIEMLVVNLNELDNVLC